MGYYEYIYNYAFYFLFFCTVFKLKKKDFICQSLAWKCCKIFITVTKKL